MKPRGWFIVSCVVMVVTLILLPFTFINLMSGFVVFTVYILLCAALILFVMTAPAAWRSVSDEVVRWGRAIRCCNSGEN